MTEQSVSLDYFRLYPAYVQQTEDLAKAREALVAAETSRQHLQDRVNDLLKQIKADEEKISVYERKAQPGASLSDGQDTEQQLKTEVAELRYSRLVPAPSSDHSY